MHKDSDSSMPPLARASTRGTVWKVVRVLNVRLRFIFLMILVGVISANWENVMNRLDRWRRPVHATEAAAPAETEYYCPMHPNIIRAEPGNCPICGMPLSKRTKSEKGGLPPDALARVQLSPFKVQMGRIATAPVEYRLVAQEIPAFGTIEYDETRVAHASARIKGRLDKLYVNFVGQKVEKGGPLYSIYSPELLIAQQELLSAVRSGKSDEPTQNIDAAKRKLLLWGITEEQIEEIIRRGTAETTMTVLSPLSGIVTEKTAHLGHYVSVGEDIYTIVDLSTVWMQAKVFEDQIAGIAIGTAVEIASTAYPNETFAGRITFIAYNVDPSTRTIAARVEIANPGLLLKPGMYARAAIRLPAGRVTPLDPAASQPDDTLDRERFAVGYYCPVQPDRLYDEPHHCPIDGFPIKYSSVEKVLCVPESAVINTGTRRIVYRETDPGVFDMIEVKLGTRAGEFYPVLSGMAPGDRVATRGAFLVDAENRLNPAASAAYFGATGGPEAKDRP